MAHGAHRGLGSATGKLALCSAGGAALSAAPSAAAVWSWRMVAASADSERLRPATCGTLDQDRC